MRVHSELRERLRALIFRSREERDLEDELQFHLELEMEKNLAQGLSAEESRRRAKIAFGGVERHKQAVREARGTRGLEDVRADLRYAARTLRKSPGFTLVAVLTLALGIGATTAIFSVVHAVLLRPLAIADQERVVTVWRNYPQTGVDRSPLTLVEFRHWREETALLREVAVLVGGSPLPYAWKLGPDAEPERIGTTPVSQAFFGALGVEPILGRTFRPEDQWPNAEPAVILSHGLWQSRFGADRSVVGTSIYTISGLPLTVVGIMPPDFDYPQGTDIWFPFLGTFTGSETAAWLHAIGRLEAGATVESAQVELQGLAEQLAAERPELGQNPTIIAEPIAETIVGDVRPAVLLLFAAVAVVLLIACVNVANLLLVRTSTRKREYAVRAALGAGRGRIIRQQLSESVLLACVGGLAGVLLASWGLKVLLAIAPDRLPRIDTAAIDGVVLAFTLAVSLATAVGFGLAPALHARKPDVTIALKEGAEGSGGSPRRRRLARALVVGELALALVLLIGAGLLLQSLVRQQRIDRGFRTENLLVALVTPSSAKYQAKAQRLAFFRQLVSRVEGLPGVVSATPALKSPAGTTRGTPTVPFRLEREGEVQGLRLDYEVAGSDYFRTLGIPLLQGRTFGPGDRENAPKVAIVNEGFAERFWPGEDPIGKRLKLGRAESDPWLTIVGVVGDTRYYQVTSADLTLYVPLQQALRTPVRILVRTASDPARIIDAIRREIRALDPDLPLDRIATMDDLSSSALARPRFNTVLLGIFSLLALGLAGVGVYGVMASFVAQRRHEIGVRMALGAGAGNVRRLMLREGIVLSVAGLGLGVALAWVATRALSSLLFGISSTDPVTFTGVVAFLGGVTLLASYLPARQATRVDPLGVLRSE